MFWEDIKNGTMSRDEFHEFWWNLEPFRDKPMALKSFRYESDLMFDFYMRTDMAIQSETVSPVVIDAFIESGLVDSRNEVRRLAKQNGLSVDNEKVADVETVLDKGQHLLGVGKKRKKFVTVE